MLEHLTDTLTQIITNFYMSTGLLGIALAMAIESCCIPLPSEVIMPVAGIMLAQDKILHGVNFWVALILIALAGAIGCLLGSAVAYWIGYKGGRPLMLKYGRYVLISQHDADKADAFFRRWGSATAFFSRLLPVVRTYISLPAGISQMNFTRFAIYTLLGSFPWCLMLAYAGTVLGNNLGVLSSALHGLDAVIIAVLVVLIALYIWRHVHNDKKARAAHAAAQAANQAQSSGPAAPALQTASYNVQQGWSQPQGQPQMPASPHGPQPHLPQQSWPTPQQPWPAPPAQNWPTPDVDRTTRRP